MAQHGRLSVAHLALDCDLRIHVDTTEPRAKHGDGNSWHGKHRCEIYHSEELEEHGGRDFDKPAKCVRDWAVHWRREVVRFVCSAQDRGAKTYKRGCPV